MSFNWRQYAKKGGEQGRCIEVPDDLAKALVAALITKRILGSDATSWALGVEREAHGANIVWSDFCSFLPHLRPEQIEAKALKVAEHLNEVQIVSNGVARIPIVFWKYLIEANTRGNWIVGLTLGRRCSGHYTAHIYDSDYKNLLLTQKLIKQITMQMCKDQVIRLVLKAHYETGSRYTKFKYLFDEWTPRFSL